MCFSKINSSTIGTMRRTAITVCYLQMLCLLVVLLLSSKSCFSRWGTAFFKEFSLFVGVPVCFLRRVALHAVLSALGFFEGLPLFVGLLGLWGCLACGVAWLVGLLGLWRGDLLSLCFSVSINKLEVYE